MPTSQVVYLPAERRDTLGSDIGRLLGAAVGSQMIAEAQKRRQQEQQQFVEGVRQAPNRSAAFEVVSNYSSKFKSPQDYTTALRMVDEFHPASMETPTPLTAYSPETGEPTTVFPTRKEMADPNYWRQSGVSLTKPTMEDFYMPVENIDAGKGDTEPVYQQVGKLPVGKRPPGALTKDEITLAQSARKEARAARGEERKDRAQQLAEERMAIATRRLELAEQKTQATLDRVGAALGDKDAQHGQSTVQAAIRLTAISMNAKQLPDGTWDFAGDVNRAEQFTKMVEYINTRVDANPKMLKSPTAASRLFTEARRSVLGSEEKKPEENKPTPASSKPGIISRLLGKGGEEKKQVPQPKMSKEERDTTVESARAAAERVRNSGMSTSEKKDAMREIRNRLEKAGLGDVVL